MKKKFEEYYFEGYYSGIANFTKRRDKELSNWFAGMFRYINTKYPIKSGNGKKLIEYGCATGAVSVMLRDFGWNVTATDISSYAIKRAQKNYKDIKFLVQDMERPVRNAKFDLAIAFDVIEHLPHPEIGIKNVYNALEKGGSVIFSTPNDYPHVYNDPTHVSVKTPKEWLRIFKKAGFNKIFIKQIALIPYLYRWHSIFSQAAPFAIKSRFFNSPVIIIAQK